MSIPELSLYKALKLKLGEDTALELVEFVKSEVKTEFDYKTDVFLTKDDKVDLIDRIDKAKNQTIIWIVGIGVLQFVLTILAKLYLGS